MFALSGTVTKYLAVAMGSAQEGAEAMLQEQYNENMSMEGTTEYKTKYNYKINNNKLNLRSKLMDSYAGSSILRLPTTGR